MNGTTAKVNSSSGGKFYDVEYDPSAGAIMTNDNGSYWKGYLGYPAIAFLMLSGTLPYDSGMGELVKGIAWKDVNTKFKNDFQKTLDFILADIQPDSREQLATYVQQVQQGITHLNLDQLGKKKTPPAGY